MPRIEVLRNGKLLREVELDEAVAFIGREVGMAVRLQDPDVSRRHARLIIKEGSYWVEDLESTHGIFLNGRRCFNEQLNDGDRIQVGSYMLRFLKEAGEHMPHFHVGTTTAANIQAELPTMTELNKTRPISDARRPLERAKNLARTEPHLIRSKPAPPKLMAIKHVRNSVGMADACHIREFATGRQEAALLIKDMDGQVTIRKSGLLSAVKVNGKTVAEQLLNDGDNITIGSAEFVFRSGRGVG